MNKTETSFLLVEKGVQLNELKPTENGRFLWMHESRTEDYSAKCRIAFAEPHKIEDRIQTEHVCVIKSGAAQVDIIIEVENRNFIPAPQRQRCKIIEKERGISCKCSIDKAAV